MPIIAQDIITRVRQALDAEENVVSPQLGYYSDEKDIIPNINNAIRWLVSTINSLLEEKKFSSELLRELNVTQVFQTNAYSRFSFSLKIPSSPVVFIPIDVWTILAIYPKIKYIPTAAAFIPPAQPQQSHLRADVTFISADESAKRLTVGEWNKNKGNPFADGNLIFNDNNCPDLVSWAWLEFSNYTSDNYPLSIPQEIEIRPDVSNSFVGVVYIKVPLLITGNTDIIEFPTSAANLIYEKTLNLISQKISDNTTLTVQSDKQLTELLQSIM